MKLKITIPLIETEKLLSEYVENKFPSLKVTAMRATWQGTYDEAEIDGFEFDVEEKNVDTEK